MQKSLLISIRKYTYRQTQSTIHLLIYHLHHPERQLLMRYPTYNRMLQYMRKRTMSYIMQQHCRQHTILLCRRNHMPLQSQLLNCLSHQMHCPQRMLKSRMLRARIHHICQSQLLYPSQSLKQRVLHQLINQLIRYRYKTQHWVVYNLMFIRHTKHITSLSDKLTLLFYISKTTPQPNLKQHHTSNLSYI